MRLCCVSLAIWNNVYRALHPLGRVRLSALREARLIDPLPSSLLGILIASIGLLILLLLCVMVLRII